MNEYLIRLEYDQWRKRNRIRHSQARWESFLEGFRNAACRFPELFEELPALPPNKQEFVLSVLREAINISKTS